MSCGILEIIQAHYNFVTFVMNQPGDAKKILCGRIKINRYARLVLRNILNGGIWYYIHNNEDHTLILKLRESRCKIGKFIKPGYYYLMKYRQPCPRACCEDDVHELIYSIDLISEIKENMYNLSDLLKEARKLPPER